MEGTDNVFATGTVGNVEGRVDMERDYFNGKFNTVTEYLSWGVGSVTGGGYGWVNEPIPTEQVYG